MSAGGIRDPPRIVASRVPGGSGEGPRRDARAPPNPERRHRCPLPHPGPGLAGCEGFPHACAAPRGAEPSRREGETSHGSSATGTPEVAKQTRGSRSHGAVLQTGLSPLQQSPKGLNTGPAFVSSLVQPRGHLSRSPPLCIAGALQSASNLDDGLLTPPLTILLCLWLCSRPWALARKRFEPGGCRKSTRERAREVFLLPPTHTSPEQVGGEVGVVPPPLHRERLRAAEAPTARRGRGQDPHRPPWTPLRPETLGARWCKSPWRRRRNQRVATTPASARRQHQPRRQPWSPSFPTSLLPHHLPRPR